MTSPAERQAQLALREVLRDRLARVALDEAPVSVAVIDSGHRIVIANARFQQTFGGAATGGLCYAVYKGLEAPCEGCPVERARRLGRPTESEEEGRTPDGEEAIWSVRAVPLPAGEGPGGPPEHVRGSAGPLGSCILTDHRLRPPMRERGRQ